MYGYFDDKEEYEMFCKRFNERFSVFFREFLKEESEHIRCEFSDFPVLHSEIALSPSIFEVFEHSNFGINALIYAFKMEDK